MFPIRQFEARFREILEELDALCETLDSEDLEDMNAELEDALLLLSEIGAEEADRDEQLADALDELSALAGDYMSMADGVPGREEPARRLEMAVELARENLDG